MTIVGFEEPTYSDLVAMARTALDEGDLYRANRIATRVTGEAGTTLSSDEYADARRIFEATTSTLLGAELARAIESAKHGDFTYVRHHVSRVVAHAHALEEHGGGLGPDAWSAYLESEPNADVEARVATAALGSVDNQAIGIETLAEFLDAAIAEHRGLEGPLAEIGKAAYLHRPTKPFDPGRLVEGYLHFAMIGRDASSSSD